MNQRQAEELDGCTKHIVHVGGWKFGEPTMLPGRTVQQAYRIVDASGCVRELHVTVTNRGKYHDEAWQLV